MPKLSEAQARVLRFLRDGGSIDWHPERCGAVDTVPKVRVAWPTLNVLDRRGLVTHTGWRDYRLTDAGRAALAAAGKGAQ